MRRFEPCLMYKTILVPFAPPISFCLVWLLGLLCLAPQPQGGPLGPSMPSSGVVLQHPSTCFGKQRCQACGGPTLWLPMPRKGPPVSPPPLHAVGQLASTPVPGPTCWTAALHGCAHWLLSGAKPNPSGQKVKYAQHQNCLN